MKNILYQHGGIMVSNSLLKTPRRTYRIKDIEKIAIKRPLLWFSLPIALGALGLLTLFKPYLYDYEQYICLAACIFLPTAGWSFGTLVVTSKAITNDVAAFGDIYHLNNAREALDKVIFSLLPHSSDVYLDDEENHHG